MACTDAASAWRERSLTALAVTARTRIPVLAALVEDASSVDGCVNSHRLGEVCRSQTGMTGAGVMLMSGDQPYGSLCASDEVSALIEELQFTVGEGPGIDAWRHDQPVLEPDLAMPATPRWPAFTGPAVRAGVRATFAFPVHVGPVRVGVLNLYAARPGSLTDDQYAEALALAEVAGKVILGIQAGALPGALAAWLYPGSNFHDVAHQAAGMAAAQLGTEAGQALVRLRAYAFANDRPLTEVAVDVVARRLRFDHRDA